MKYTIYEQKKLKAIQFQLRKLRKEDNPDWNKVEKLKMQQHVIRKNAAVRASGNKAMTYDQLKRKVNAMTTLNRMLEESKQRQLLKQKNI